MASTITERDWITHCYHKGVWVVSQIIDHQIVAIKLAATPKPVYKIFNITDCKKYERLDYEEDSKDAEALQGKVVGWVNKIMEVQVQ